MNDQNILTLNNVFKSYSENEVLLGLSLNLNEGECVGIVGKNGSGKTTLLRIIAGLLLHFSGYVNRHGKVVSALIEAPAFINEFTGRENIEYFLPKKYQTHAISLAKSLDVNEYLDKPVRAFSQGMRQKLALSIVFARDTDIILLDEPFNSIDIESSNRIIELINNSKDKGKGIIVVTHNISKIDTYCDKVLSLESGILKLSDKTRNIDQQKYKIQFSLEDDFLQAQTLLGEYILEADSITKNTLTVTFLNGGLASILKKLSTCNILNIVEIKFNSEGGENG
ncbi:MAG: ATP-binding cassette domain-containing protein [Christensenellaceae bacterium]|jgi:ABC-2 type transport system ATP-binding protein|nr:ATP-binding cassette domain-containing protein [Christensenellaceae bacterium]